MEVDRFQHISQTSAPRDSSMHISTRPTPLGFQKICNRLIEIRKTEPEILEEMTFSKLEHETISNTQGLKTHPKPKQCTHFREIPPNYQQHFHWTNVH